MSEQGSGRLWGGRFAEGPSAALTELSRSTQFDFRLVPYDLAQTRAHAGVLHAAGLLTDAELRDVRVALDALNERYDSGDFVPAPDDEDVHSAVERELVAALGETGGKLRAGRSRNDQVATDFRLYLRDAAARIRADVLDLCEALVRQAARHADDPAPGFTHLQHAQPVTLGHELAKHVHALLRDVDRLDDWDVRASVSPLGSGALSGSALPLDPERAGRELGFARAAGNSIDAVSDRDFVAEFLFVAAMIGVHLSRIGEEVCLWTSREFGWATLHDSWSTGSSIMPQKKNPDIAELARGKSGRLIGNLTGVLVALKGLAFAYNRDLQEDKEGAFDSVDTLGAVLPAITGMVATLTFHPEVMRASAPAGYSLATEIADWLVLRHVPFRRAHEIAGACVRAAEERGIELDQLSAEDLAAIADELTPEVLEVLDVDGALAARATRGGTAPEMVRRQVAELGVEIDALRAGR